MCTNKTWITNPYNLRRYFVSCGRCEACKQLQAAKRASKIRSNYDFIGQTGKKVCFFVTLSYENIFIPYCYREDIANFTAGLSDDLPVYRDVYLKPIRVKGNRRWRYKYFHCSTPETILSSDDFILRNELSYEPISIVENKGLCCSSKSSLFDIFNSNKNFLPIVENTYFVPRTEPIRYPKKRFEFHSSEINPFEVSQDDFKGMVVSHVGENIEFNVDKVPVSLYKDVQLFFKRLRQILVRNFGIKSKFEYVAVTEYGSTTQRPHVHLLLFFDSSFLTSVEKGADSCFTPYSTIKRAVLKAWPYGRFYSSKQFQIARNPASYVASYVCSNQTLPLLFQSPVFRPKFHTSQGFGTGLSAFQLPQVVDAYLRKDLHFVSKRVRNDQLVEDTLLYPKFVISRYFPKFKGYCRLTSNEVYDIARCPQNVFKYWYKLGCTYDECRKIEVLLNHKRDCYVKSFYLQKALPRVTFEEVYTRIWPLYESTKIIDHYSNNYGKIDYLYNYDNLPEYMQQHINALKLGFSEYNSHVLINDSIMNQPDNLLELLDNANLYPTNVAKTDKLIYYYYVYDKTRKVTNRLITELQNNF